MKYTKKYLKCIYYEDNREYYNNYKKLHDLPMKRWNAITKKYLRREQKMICVIDQIKYDTDKMEMVSDKIHHEYKVRFLSYSYLRDGDHARLWRSHKGRWLMTYGSDCNEYAVPMTENQAKQKLMMYDIATYERLFGELEEA